uniref:Uncharacterized protein n=1 Tax=Anguilla anguilla TaxID=7936 RepID=A0A0E9SB56_ANGAN
MVCEIAVKNDPGAREYYNIILSQSQESALICLLKREGTRDKERLLSFFSAGVTD